MSTNQKDWDKFHFKVYSWLDRIDKETYIYPLLYLYRNAKMFSFLKILLLLNVFKPISIKKKGYKERKLILISSNLQTW